jgi:hypothetical protein
VRWLSPLLLLPALGCAQVRETQTRTVLDAQSVRLSEVARPDLSRPNLRVTLSGRELALTVTGEARCVVQFGERVTVREHTVRVPSATTLAGEAVLMGVGLIVAASNFRANASDGREVLGPLALIGGLGAGVALGVDASRHADHESVETTTEPDGPPRVAPCERRASRATKVELVTPAGRRFVAPLDGFGRGRVTLPDDVFADGAVDFDVRIDGVVVRRLVLRRAP